jgi:hypothetical protein
MKSRFCGIAMATISVVTLFAGTAAAERKVRATQIVPTGAEDAVAPVEDDGTRLVDALTNDSTEGLTVIQRADGTQSIDLQGRFQHVLRVAKTEDGKTEMSCNADAKLGKAMKPWTPQKGKGLRVKPWKAPIVVAPAQLEVK